MKSRRNKQSAVRHSKNIKNSEKSKSKKDTKAIRTTQPPANSTQADSEAILPNRTQLVFLRAVFHMKYYKVTLRENGLQRPAKGGSTPAFAYQRAAIAPLPCPNLQTCFSLISQLRICKFSKKRLQQKNRLQNSICFANVGCSPTPRQHF